MKKFYILMIAMSLVNGACQRSQFATTTRHSSNGKVTYVNHYPAVRSKSSKVKYPKNHLTEIEAQNNSMAPDRSSVQNLPEPEIAKINSASMSYNENLIASNSSEPTLIAVRKDQIVSVDDLILSLKKHYGFNTNNSLPDTIKSHVPKKGTNDSETHQVIKFKNGHEETVRIINQSHDTLKYHLINESNLMRYIMMEQIDTILQVKSYSGKEKVVDARKTEKLGIVGLIFSIIGWIPLIGIPFALLAIIFGSVSLAKIRRHPEKFKGKEIAIAGIVIWVIGLIGYIILLLMGTFAA
jgi:hypothetical protein